MSAVVSLEFVFDAVGDAAIRREWEILERAGLPNQSRHTGATNRPHVTLLVRTRLTDLDGGALEPHLPLGVGLGAPLLFGGLRTRVLARSVLPTPGLLGLHAAVHALAGGGDDAPHTVPGDWSPHVTLARRLPTDRVGEALAALAEQGGDRIDARVIGIRRWDAGARTVSHVAGGGTLEPC